MELRCGKPACPKLRLLIRLCAQKNVSVESFIEVENGRTQIVENKNSFSLSYEQNKVVFSGCANTDLGQQKRGTRPAGSQQQMALCNSIVSAASLRRKDLPVIGGSAGRWRFRHDAEIDNGIDLVELSPSLSTRMEICDPEIAVLLAIFRISGAEQRKRKGRDDPLRLDAGKGRLAASAKDHGQHAQSTSDHRN